VVLVPFAIPFFLVSNEANAYVQLFFKTLLPATLACFCIFGFYDAGCIKLGLYQRKVVGGKVG